MAGRLWDEANSLSLGRQDLTYSLVSGTVAFIDLEGNVDTNGLVSDPNKHSGIIEIGVIILSMATWQLLDIFHSVVRPVGRIPPFVTRHVHGINAHSLVDAPEWDTVKRDLTACLRRHQVTAVVGLGTDVMTLLKSLPVWGITYLNIRLPTWQERQYTDYFYAHLDIWAHYTELPQASCGAHTHQAYTPNISANYREKTVRNVQRKAFYGYHCALKDAFFMLVSLRFGIECDSWGAAQPYIPRVRATERHTTQDTTNTTPSNSQTESTSPFILEGFVHTDPGFVWRLRKEIEAFIRNAMKGPASAPTVAPLFTDTLQDTEKSQILTHAFTEASIRVARAQNTNFSPFTVLHTATLLGSANFCDVNATLSNCLPRKTILWLTTQDYEQCPSHIRVIKCPRDRLQVSQILRRERKRIHLADTSHVVLENIVRTMQVHIVRNLLSTTRGLFSNVPIYALIYGPAPILALTTKVGKRYRVQARAGVKAQQSLDAKYPELTQPR